MKSEITMVKIFLLALITLSVVGTTEIFAQRNAVSNKAVRIIARRNDSTISLRWAPTTPEIFSLGKKNGYKVERAEIRGSSVGDFTLVNGGHTVMHWPMGGWQWFLSQMKERDSSRMMYLHIGYSMLFSDSLNAISGLNPQEQSEADKAQYSYAMLASDRDSMAAVGMGLRFEDYFITTGQRYLYRITILGDVPKGLDPTDTITVEGQSYRSPNKTSLRADELENAVTLYWNTYSDYAAHQVERSDNGGKTYFPLDNAPIITLITGDTLPSNIEHYADTALTNYKVYHYRVYGYTSFGSKELLGEVKAMPRDRTPPDMPTEVHADNFAVNKVKITWRMPEPVARDLAGFHIGKDTVDQGDVPRFPHITTKMLSANAREFIDESGVFADKNYYVIDAYDTAHNVIRSFSAYCVMIDSTPPSVPVLVKGMMDSNGVVTINFTPPKERDYMGYRLLRANDTTHEYSVIRERFTTDSMNISSENTLSDIVEVRTLTHFVYYKMYALDFHYNESGKSIALQVRRPDIIPPVTPVITGYLVSDSNVAIEFVPSSSDDVAYNKLLRKRSADEKWDSVMIVSPNSRTVIDRSGAVNSEYDYALQAADEGGLFSDISNIITAKRYDNGLRNSVRNIKAQYDASKKEVTLSWDYDDLGEPFSYIIYRNDPEKLSSYSLIKDKGARSFKDSLLPNQNTLRYAVKVVTESGAESKLSEPVVVTVR